MGDLIRRQLVHGLTLVDPLTYGGIRDDLREFALELRGVIPMLHFYQYSSNRLHVAYSGDPHTVGMIGYDDWRDSVHYGDPEERKYAVFANSIENNKYGTHNTKHRMSASKDINVAVRTARKHLRRPRDRDVAVWVFTQCLPAITTHYGHRYSEFSEHARRLLSAGGYIGFDPGDYRKEPYINELLAAHERGDIMNREFADGLTKLVSMEKELLEMNADNAEWHIVVVRNNARDEPRIVTVKMLVSGPPSGWGNSFQIADEAYVMEPHEVPEDIQGKTSVLNMVDFGHYVEDVGVRMAEGCYYINTNEAPKL